MNKHETLFTLQDYLEIELEEAKINLEVAYNHFNHCDPEFTDYCILQIEAAKAKLSAILKNMKKEGHTREQNDIGNRSDFVANFVNRVLGSQG